MTELTIRPTFTSAGALARLDAGDLSLLQYPASELEPGPHQVWLRWRSPDGHRPLGLTGPAGGGTVVRAGDGIVLRGREDEVEWELWWDQPAGGGRFGWGLRVVNHGEHPVELDAVWTVDAALTPWDALRRNEFYVAQYLDLTPISDGDRLLIAVRQNMPGDANPWLALGATRRVVGWCTDALQLRPDVPGTGLDLSADLPAERLQHEHTLAGLQTEPWRLAPGEEGFVGYRGVVVADHPEASSDEDAERVRGALADGWAEAAPSVSGDAAPAEPTLFSPPRFAHGEDLHESEFLRLVGGGGSVERGPDGEAWSYSVGGAHVVAAAKERAVLRPHGHIVRASAGARPQDPTAAVTAWMGGTFASQLTLGNASGEPLLSIRRSYLGLVQTDGVRLFVRDGDEGWRLLGQPSAWAADDSSATWWYRLGERTVQVETRLTLARLTVRVDVGGAPLDVLVSISTPDDWRTEEHPATSGFALEIPVGGPDAPAADAPVLRLHGDDPTSERLDAFLPWLVHNAHVHYQAPRGLEQFTGGAWGTRDVCQGPVGLLVATGRLRVVRDVLLAVFAGQQDDGDWPQWFQYLAADRGPGHRESHGDVVYWPLLALGEYLQMTGDLGILDEEVGWVGQAELLPATPLRAHVEAAVDHLLSARSADPRLPAYGHGDWNDSLQPANPDLARQMVSTWTAELEVKALSTLADGLGSADAEMAERLRAIAAETEAAIRDSLLIDGELCGYAVVADGRVEPIVHPRDARTGLRHGSLQVIHAIADELLTPEEAESHVRIVDEHLDGPTGIYLFDRPVDYHGGETHTFLRAEAASFWGREIGLMYTHAHLRWIEALLRLGLADRAWRALDLVIPDGLTAAVPGALPRQSNTYFSSVDAAFRDRADAEARADRMFDPEFGFEGGWRVYSSGPGLILRLVTEGFLGLRQDVGGLLVDPVLPAGRYEAVVPLGGLRVRARYHVAAPGHGVQGVEVDGDAVATEPVPRRYRAGGVRIPADVWADLVAGLEELILDIRVGG
ncbi:GH36-type glycosyl hydrolase domain-containing protein [Tessaracoccus oleiagri]|uniref:Uncharacterized protein n=1 Tax=Tessaracoccus oleiagri TaxID=686624 RepID=A0A1G9HM94_9ACTN|nr:hypothetical protein [Tessaracoccus oleiagri]SDL14049.1 hypothetical protein SAMN04488242_0405 [Tessaracoccus oleiagri]